MAEDDDEGLRSSSDHGLRSSSDQGSRAGEQRKVVRGSGLSEGPSPPFLDMVPWYSGTSADLFKTGVDLMISLKLFLGRFDMRTMQVGGLGGREPGASAEH